VGGRSNRQTDVGDIERRLWQWQRVPDRSQDNPQRSDADRQPGRQQKCRGDMRDGTRVRIPATPYLELEVIAEPGEND
jgi:hypothetical protein